MKNYRAELQGIHDAVIMAGCASGSQNFMCNVINQFISNDYKVIIFDLHDGRDGLADLLPQHRVRATQVSGNLQTAIGSSDVVICDLVSVYLKNDFVDNYCKLLNELADITSNNDCVFIYSEDILSRCFLELKQELLIESYKNLSLNCLSVCMVHDTAKMFQSDFGKYIYNFSEEKIFLKQVCSDMSVLQEYLDVETMNKIALVNNDRISSVRIYELGIGGFYKTTNFYQERYLRKVLSNLE